MQKLQVLFLTENITRHISYNIRPYDTLPCDILPYDIPDTLPYDILPTHTDSYELSTSRVRG
jgi:hypothetical protein